MFAWDQLQAAIEALRPIGPKIAQLSALTTLSRSIGHDRGWMSMANKESLGTDHGMTLHFNWAPTTPPTTPQAIFRCTKNVRRLKNSLMNLIPTDDFEISFSLKKFLLDIMFS